MKIQTKELPLNSPWQTKWGWVGKPLIKKIVSTIDMYMYNVHKQYIKNFAHYEYTISELTLSYCTWQRDTTHNLQPLSWWSYFLTNANLSCYMTITIQIIQLERPFHFFFSTAIKWQRKTSDKVLEIWNTESLKPLHSLKCTECTNVMHKL